MTYDLLVKIMMMTTSDNDMEALVAIRKANDFLKLSGVNWQDVFKGLPSPQGTRQEKPTARNYNDLEEEDDEGMVNFLYETVNTKYGFFEFIASMKMRMATLGFLTEGQHKVIRKAYLRNKEWKKKA